MQVEGVKAMELFGRELSLEQMVGLVECNATPDEDLVHRAALEIIAALRESQRRERVAAEDIHTVYSNGLCEVCGRRDTCLMTLDRGEDGTVCHGIRFEWRGPEITP